MKLEIGEIVTLIDRNQRAEIVELRENRDHGVTIGVQLEGGRYTECALEDLNPCADQEPVLLPEDNHSWFVKVQKASNKELLDWVVVAVSVAIASARLDKKDKAVLSEFIRRLYLSPGNNEGWFSRPGGGSDGFPASGWAARHHKKAAASPKKHVRQVNRGCSGFFHPNFEHGH